MKILITGADGQLGRCLLTACARHELLPFTHPSLQGLGRKKATQGVLVVPTVVSWFNRGFKATTQRSFPAVDKCCPSPAS